MARMRAVHNGFVIRPCTTSSTCSLIELPKSDTSQSNGTMGFVMIDRNPFWSGENVFWDTHPEGLIETHVRGEVTVAILTWCHPLNNHRLAHH